MCIGRRPESRRVSFSTKWRFGGGVRGSVTPASAWRSQRTGVHKALLADQFVRIASNRGGSLWRLDPVVLVPGGFAVAEALPGARTRLVGKRRLEGAGVRSGTLARRWVR